MAESLQLTEELNAWAHKQRLNTCVQENAPAATTDAITSIVVNQALGWQFAFKLKCTGCKLLIDEQHCYYLNDGRAWHADCLTCGECRRPLNSETRCFTKHGQIFCKRDYQRIFGRLETKGSASKTCKRCLRLVKPSDLVIRTPSDVFHIDCFYCIRCGHRLKPGNKFVLEQSDLPVCLADAAQPMFSTKIQRTLNIDFVPVTSQKLQRSPEDTNSDVDSAYEAAHSTSADIFGDPNCPMEFTEPQQSEVRHFTSRLKDDTLPSEVRYSIFPKYEQTVRSGLQFGCQSQRHGRKRRNNLHECLGGMYSDGLISYGLGVASRQKRIRTSFKHNQLRAMKAFFVVNHNPDAKDLKLLSEKTGLSKRVLQVWFQNARAKYRRSAERPSTDANEAISKQVTSFDIQSPEMANDSNNSLSSLVSNSTQETPTPQEFDSKDNNERM